MSCSQYVAAFGFQLYIVPVAACGIDLADVTGGLNPTGFFNPAAALSEGIRIEEGVVPAEILAGDPGANVVYDGETVMSQAVFQLRGITNASLETDTGTEAIITYDEEGKGFDQNVALSKSWTLSVEAVTNFTDSAYKVIRLLEANAVSGQLKAKIGRLGPTGTTEAIYGYCSITNFSESVEAGGIVTWSCEMQGYGPLSLELDNGQSINLVGPINTLSIFNAGGSLKDGAYPDQLLTGGSGNGLATADILVNAGQVASVTLVDAGDGYQELNNLGANLPGADVEGTVTSLTRTANGNNLANGTFAAEALLDGDGIGATVNVTVSGNTVTASTLAQAGSGYVSGDPLTVDLSPQANPSAGEVLTLSGLVSGGGYDNGTYTNQAVTGGSGTGLQLNITVSGEAVTSVTVANGGTGYSVGDDFTTTLDPATIEGTYAIEDAILSDPGADLANGIYPAMAATGGTGTGATADFTVAGGVVTLYSGVAMGTGYTVGDLLTFNLTGAGNPFQGEIQGVFPTVGSNLLNGTYSHSPTGSSGTGAIFDATVSGGTASLTLVDGGTGFAVDDVLTFNLPAAINPDLGEILALDQPTLAGGIGYLNGFYPAVALSGGGGSGATADILVAGASVVQVTLVSGGINYNSTDVLSAADADLGNTTSGAGFNIEALAVDEAETLTATQPTVTVTDVSGAQVSHTDPQIEVTAVDEDAPATPTPWSISATGVEPDFLTAIQPTFSVDSVATVEAPHADPVFRVTSLLPD